MADQKVYLYIHMFDYPLCVEQLEKTKRHSDAFKIQDGGRQLKRVTFHDYFKEVPEDADSNG